MNKLIITIVTTMLLTVTGTAFSQDPSGEPGRKGQRDRHGMQEMPVVGQIMHALKQLDLNEEQQANIKAVRHELKTEVQPIMKELNTGHRQLKELIKAESYNKDAVAELAKKEGELATQRIVLTAEALSKALGYLSDEQRDQLGAMAAERKKQRAKKHEGRVKES